MQENTVCRQASMFKRQTEKVDYLVSQLRRRFCIHKAISLQLGFACQQDKCAFFIYWCFEILKHDTIATFILFLWLLFLLVFAVLCSDWSVVFSTSSCAVWFFWKSWFTRMRVTLMILDNHCSVHTQYVYYAHIHDHGKQFDGKVLMATIKWVCDL